MLNCMIFIGVLLFLAIGVGNLILELHDAYRRWHTPAPIIPPHQAGRPWTTPQAAKELGMRQRRLWNMIGRGDVVAVWVEGRRYIADEEMRRLVARLGDRPRFA